MIQSRCYPHLVGPSKAKGGLVSRLSCLHVCLDPFLSVNAFLYIKVTTSMLIHVIKCKRFMCIVCLSVRLLAVFCLSVNTYIFINQL